jgi:hypothetical protein
MAIVKVPKTPKSSFNKNRRPSALLLDQIKHLEWAALPASQRKPHQLAKYRQVKTESQAAERIAQLTTMVLKAKEGGVRPPAEDGLQPKVALPPLPKAADTTKTRKAKKSKRSKRKTKPARPVARKSRARGKQR